MSAKSKITQVSGASPPVPTESEKEVFVSRYLATMNPGAEAEIAMLASSLAPRASAFDAKASVSQAIAIREESSLAIRARRSALLAQANGHCLNALWHRIAAGRPESERAKDPHLASINGAMENCGEEATRQWTDSPERGRQRAEQMQMILDAERKIGTKPSLPCPVEEAIRWSISGGEVATAWQWDMIEGAFIDFLSVLEAQEQHQKALDPKWGSRPDAVRWVELHRQALAHPDVKAEDAANHEKEISKYQAIIDETDALGVYASKFEISAEVPNSIGDHGKKAYARHWRGMEADEADLLFLAADFREFWQHHSHAYLKHHDEAIKARKEEKALAKATIDKMEEAGRARARSRTRDRWVRYAQEFVNFAAGRKISPELINSFPKQDDVKDAKGKEFLKTLLTAQGNKILFEDLSETLANVRIKMLPEVAQDCYLILLEGKIVQN